MNKDLRTVLAYAATGPAEVRAAAAKLTPGKRQRKHVAPGRTKEQRDEERAVLYAYDKRQAFIRAGAWFGEDGTVIRPPRCEYDMPNGRHCPLEGVDPDHALGGSSRKECERLGAEGLIITCRAHHNLKTNNNPTRRHWLDQAKRHALQHGFKRLLALVEKAIARDEMKHPERRSTEP